MDQLNLSEAETLSAFLAHLGKGRRRTAPPRRAAGLLARPLSTDARALLEVWAAHRPPHVAIGELWLDGDDLGDAVPSPGDVDLQAEPRTDVIMFAHSPGGDLFALRQGEDEQFREVVRVIHDRGWEEVPVARDLASFVRQCLMEAKANGEGTTIDPFLPKFNVVACQPVPLAPTPVSAPAEVVRARRLPPGSASHVSASPSGRRFLVVDGAEVNVVDAVTGEKRLLDLGGGYARGAWLDEGRVVLARRSRWGATDDPAEIALSATFVGVPEGGENQVRGDCRLCLFDLEDDAQDARPSVYEMNEIDGDLSAVADGVVVIVSLPTRGKIPTYSLLRVTPDGLTNVTRVKKDLGTVYAVSGRWYGSAGFELANLGTAPSSPRSEVWPVRARLSPEAARTVPDDAASRAPITKSKAEFTLKGASVGHERWNDDDPLSTVAVTLDTPTSYDYGKGVYTHQVRVNRDAVAYTPAHRFIGDSHSIVIVADGGGEPWARTVPFPVARLWREHVGWLVADDRGTVWSLRP